MKSTQFDLARLRSIPMPILDREPDLFPEDLLESPTSEASRWMVIHTLPRREKELMRRLRQLEIPYYGPQIARRFRSPQGRKRVSYIPLFASYVFTAVGEDQKPRIHETNCVCQCLPVEDTTRLLHDLRQVRQLIETEAPLTPEARLQPGDRVRIRSGAMVGLEGVVVRRRGQNHLLVSVEFLQVGASVQLDDCELETISV